MAKARAIAQRRRAVNNIKKITHTMQLIATARFQRSLNRAIGTRPYTDKITELVQQVSRAGGSVTHPLLKKNEEAKRRAVLLITSKRGLCGGYNANLIRTATSLMNRNHDAGYETDLHIVGKKGVSYYRFLGRKIERTYPELPDAPSFAQVEPIAVSFMRDYEAGGYSAVDVVYMRFISVARQQPDELRLLPIEAVEKVAGEAETTEAGAEARAGGEIQYDFSPEPEQLLAELLPVTVKVRLFQCFCDAVVSENVARMVAMKAATDAANEMTRMLSQRFNRARQTQITMELLDIMGGVEALK
jgi:F-type H+-transporting ATPase subunit gamma